MNTKINNTYNIKGCILSVIAFLAISGLFTSTKAFALTPLPIDTSPRLNIYLFYSQTCPHCKEEEKFLSTLNTKYPNVVVNTYEVTANKDNLDLFVKVGAKLNDKSGRVPFLVIGNSYVLGFLNAETQGVEIENKILRAYYEKSTDLVAGIINQKDNETTSPQTNPTGLQKEKLVINIPILGKVDIKGLSLPLLTVVIGLLDGFNPCAMWTLLFLISLLLGMKSRLKMWVLGGTFIFVSGLIYFVFMTAWLNFFLIVGYAPIIRTLIAVLAVGMGIFYVYDFYKNRNGGCGVMGDEKRQKTFEKIRKVVLNNKFGLAILGIALLAVAVNVVELLCSLGLPAIYTKTLTLANLPTWQYYTYMAAYIFFYMLEQIIVFLIAMFTLQAVGVKYKYTQYSHLIGGLIILALGVIMLFKPELLLFS